MTLAVLSDMPGDLDGRFARIAPDLAPAWTGSVLPQRGRPLKGAALERAAAEHGPAVSVPPGSVCLAVGELACRALVSGRMPGSLRGVRAHAASVVPAVAARGYAAPPAFTIPCFPPADLGAEDEWYPSVRLAVARAQALVAGTHPPTPPREVFLRTRSADALVAAALEAGAVAFDLETPHEEAPRNIAIGAFCVGERTWVFDGADVPAVATALFGHGITVVGQNIATFDLPVTRRNGVPAPAGPVHDTRWLDGLLRPRMPRDLAHLAAHWCAWGPPNHKGMVGTASILSDVGRDYCAIDAWLAWHIWRAQLAAVEARGLGWSLKVREANMPVVTTCATEGVRVDLGVRRELRESMAEAHAALLDEFEAAVGAWADGKATAAAGEMAGAEAEYDVWRDAAYAKKGAMLRLEYGVTPEKAAEMRDAALARLREARRMAKRYAAVRTTQKDVLREFLFTDPAGLRLRPTGRRTPSGAVAIGRKELDRLWHRADVQERVEKGDTRLLVLRVVSDAERLRAELAVHLGAPTDPVTGRANLAKETQVRDGRLSVVYNPVQMRFSAGGTGEKADPLAAQVHNMPKRVVAIVRGERRVWNLQRQIIADDPATQTLIAADWSKMEQYTMAWAAGTRVGYWDWLRELYAGVDTHCAAAAVAFEGVMMTPECREGAVCVHRKEMRDVGGRSESVRDLGKRVNHAMTLGGGAGMLCEQYAFSRKDAAAVVKRWDGSPRGAALKRLHAAIEREAVETGEVRTPFGESVDFHGFADKGDGALGMRNPKKAYAVVQAGTAAVIMQACLAPVAAVAAECGGRLLLTTHDEFLLCVAQERAKAAREWVASVMTQPWPQMPFEGEGLRLAVDVAQGAAWGACK